MSGVQVNSDKPERWKNDIAQSVDLFNSWFLDFAPETYRTTRVETTRSVEETFKRTKNLTDISPAILRQYPQVLPILRMSTAPPIARDRLIGLADVDPGLVKSMELSRRMPKSMSSATAEGELDKIRRMIERLLDLDVFPWLRSGTPPSDADRHRAATIVADRLCGAQADPIIRNAQEERQLKAVGSWLENRGYRFVESGEGLRYDNMRPGTFGFRVNVPVKLARIPIDIAIKRKKAGAGELPLFIEAKSAGDFTNTNKRRKEEAQKISQLRETYGPETELVLFLCGYFGSGYLEYEAAEGIDWVWEHRISDFEGFGL